MVEMGKWSRSAKVLALGIHTFDTRSNVSIFKDCFSLRQAIRVVWEKPSLNEFHGSDIRNCSHLCPVLAMQRPCEWFESGLMCAVVLQTCSEAHSLQANFHFDTMPLWSIELCFCALVQSFTAMTTQNQNVLEKQPLLSYSADSLNFWLHKALKPLSFIIILKFNPQT